MDSLLEEDKITPEILKELQKEKEAVIKEYRNYVREKRVKVMKKLSELPRFCPTGSVRLVGN